MITTTGCSAGIWDAHPQNTRDENGMAEKSKTPPKGKAARAFGGVYGAGLRLDKREYRSEENEK